MRLRLRQPYRLSRSLASQRFGLKDPACRMEGEAMARAFWTPVGECTLALRQDGAELEAEAVGAGAAWCLERLPAWFALPPQDLRQRAPAPVRQWALEHKGLRVGPVPWVADVLMAYILLQRVRYMEAIACYRRLLERCGRPAPGPVGLKLPLTGEQWLGLGRDRLQSEGLDLKRTQTLLRLAPHLVQVQAGLDLDREACRTYLASFKGIGPWTTEMVMGHGYGDPDAVPVGDVHLPRVVCLALTGAPGRDPDMVRALEPYQGLRFRVIRWAQG